MGRVSNGVRIRIQNNRVLGAFAITVRTIPGIGITRGLFNLVPAGCTLAPAATTGRGSNRILGEHRPRNLNKVCRKTRKAGGHIRVLGRCHRRMRRANLLRVTWLPNCAVPSSHRLGGNKGGGGGHSQFKPRAREHRAVLVGAGTSGLQTHTPTRNPALRNGPYTALDKEGGPQTTHLVRCKKPEVSGGPGSQGSIST